MPRGWRKRAKELLHLYRRELVRDKDFQSRSGKDEMGSANAGGAAINAAAEFLHAQGERRIGDDKGPAECPKRTFYLLDVFSEHRLAHG